MCGVGLLSGLPAAHASVSGTNADDVKVTVETKQGGEWFKAREVRADDDGVLELENALPGKYKFTLDEDDVESGQTLGLKIRVLDEQGREFDDERADVDVYVYVGDTKVFVATYETDKDGWLDLSGITSGTTYELDVKDEAELSSKDDKPRIKMKASIDGSDWFYASYKRIKNGWLEVEDVLPGKYKFKYKSKDVADINMPFNLRATFRDEDGDDVKNAKVKIYAYPFGTKMMIAEMRTDKDGELEIPGAMPNMKYRIKVSD